MAASTDFRAEGIGLGAFQGLQSKALRVSAPGLIIWDLELCSLSGCLAEQLRAASMRLARHVSCKALSETFGGDVQYVRFFVPLLVLSRFDLAGGCSAA